MVMAAMTAMSTIEMAVERAESLNTPTGAALCKRSKAVKFA
jgi:hypothetical protein